MPITKDNVLEVLDDPNLVHINFTIGNITVNHKGYQRVAEYIRAGDIQVIPGKENLAFYDGRHNTLETQAGTPPLNLSDCAQIVHECTHALIDIRGLNVLRLHDEVVAYLAQVTYSQIKSPSPALRTLSPGRRLIASMLQVVQQYNLFAKDGREVHIQDWDLMELTRVVQAHPEYRNIKEDEISVGAGVPVKGNSMRALREALTWRQRIRGQ